MRPLHAVLLLAWFPATALAQSEAPWPYSLEDTLGKSEAAIVSMGREAWFDLYTAQPGGSSTAGMCDAETIFGAALRRRNDRLFASSSPERLARIGAFRQHLSALYEACAGLSATFSGGGTMWNIVYAGVPASVEESVGILAGLPFKSAPPRVASDVAKHLDKVGSVLRSQRAELDLFKESGYGYAVGIAELAKARRAYEGVLNLARTLPRRQSDAILQACLDRANRIEFNVDARG